MNCSMQKGNKGKLRTGTVNKATYDWPWRAAKKPESGAPNERILAKYLKYHFLLS